MRRIALVLSLAIPAAAGEYAVLENGFRIHAEKHDVAGLTVRLHTARGTIEVPAATIVAFEAEEYVKAVPEPPPQAPASKTEPTPEELLQQAAAKHGLAPEFVHSVASAESALRPDAVSVKGAIGLMQLMPATAAELGADPKDPAQNAEAGARYLRQLLDKYKDDPDGVRLALAAYNAGPGAVDRYRNIPPYRETQNYVEKVVQKYLKQLKAKPGT